MSPGTTAVIMNTNASLIGGSASSAPSAAAASGCSTTLSAVASEPSRKRGRSTEETDSGRQSPPGSPGSSNGAGPGSPVAESAGPAGNATTAQGGTSATTPEQRQDVLRRYCEQNQGLTDIANALNINYRTVQGIVRRYKTRKCRDIVRIIEAAEAKAERTPVGEQVVEKLWNGVTVNVKGRKGSISSLNRRTSLTMSSPSLGAMTSASSLDTQERSQPDLGISLPPHAVDANSSSAFYSVPGSRGGSSSASSSSSSASAPMTPSGVRGYSASVNASVTSPISPMPSHASTPGAAHPSVHSMLDTHMMGPNSKRQRVGSEWFPQYSAPWSMAPMYGHSYGQMTASASHVLQSSMGMYQSHTMSSLESDGRMRSMHPSAYGTRMAPMSSSSSSVVHGGNGDGLRRSPPHPSRSFSE